MTKVALVTGASRGIGRAIAIQLARAGFIVVGTATSQAGADDITAALQEAGAEGCGMVLDVTDAGQIQARVNEINEVFGPPGVLINNAGITRDDLLLRMKEEDWAAIIDTNLTSVYRLCKTCLRGMIKARWGRIVNVGSVVGATGNPGQTSYAAAKAGIVGFTKSLAKEVASRGITVNTVAPGFIDTDMTRQLAEDQRRALLSAIPLGRLGEAEEVAYAVAFLCSDQAAYITGETLHVNGGMYMP